MSTAFPAIRDEIMRTRPLLAETLGGSRTAVREALAKEEALEKASDEVYWQPLKQEPARLRRRRPSS